MRLDQFGAAAIALALVACGAQHEAPEPEPSVEGPGEPRLDSAEVDRLRALGYVHVVEEEGGNKEEPVGVLIHDASLAQPGLTYYTNVHDCSSHLMTAEGEVLHSWRHRPCNVWSNTVLLPSGEVLVIHRDATEDASAGAAAKARRLLKLGWDGDFLWSRQLPAHHDFDVMPDGRIAVLTYRHRPMPAIHPTILVRDNFVQELTAEGEPLEEASLSEILLGSSDVFRLQDVEPQLKDGIHEVDLLHTNSIEWMRDPELARKNSLYAPTNVLLCLRHQDAVVIIDWSTRKVVWSWGQGEISGPHDATLLTNGNILVFDNGLERKWSRVIEVDPLENKIDWEYKAPNSRDFFTIMRGASQRVPNGNTLITDSRKGTLFEVTPDGKIVWQYRNPSPAEGRPRSAIVRARRVFEAEGGDGARFMVSD